MRPLLPLELVTSLQVRSEVSHGYFRASLERAAPTMRAPAGFQPVALGKQTLSLVDPQARWATEVLATVRAAILSHHGYRTEY